MVDIIIYMQDGRTFGYKVANAIKAREHAHRIVTLGYRNIETEVVTIDGALGLDLRDTMVYYPVHQILKVKFIMDKKDKLATEYQAE